MYKFFASSVIDEAKFVCRIMRYISLGYIQDENDLVNKILFSKKINYDVPLKRLGMEQIKAEHRLMLAEKGIKKIATIRLNLAKKVLHAKLIGTLDANFETAIELALYRRKGISK